jgi:ribosomal protein S18 acetylase RimI-like enzyme
MTNDVPVGCVGLRRWHQNIGELKRLYVVPEARGHHLGAALARAALKDAVRLGFHRVRLDTVPSMASAIALYRSLGFREIEPYRHNPIPGAQYFELAIDGDVLDRRG